jgi:hypothetical protein
LRTAPSTGEAAKLTNDVTEITSYNRRHHRSFVRKYARRTVTLSPERPTYIHAFRGVNYVKG